MRKSGLHKQISSIFDGVPVPANNAVPKSPEASETSATPLNQETTDAQPNTAQDSGSSLIKRMSGGTSEGDCAATPTVHLGRPMPLSKPKGISKDGSRPALLPTIKKTVFGTHSALDRRQRKAGLLVGILSIVFAIVLFVSLGGVGQSQAIAAHGPSGEQAVSASAHQKTAQEWMHPDPLPQDLRNATAPATAHTATSQESAASESGGLIVKGIVFSKTNPSAIINNQIFHEGQVVNGVTIAKITKESVVFEADDKRWSQFVQR